MTKKEDLGWRIVGPIIQEGQWFRATASYVPEDAVYFSKGAPKYRMTDRGTSPEEAKRILLLGCAMDKKWPKLAEGITL